MTANITHAPVMHMFDGVEYEFSPLTLEDMEFLELYLKSRAISAGRASLPEGVDDETADKMMAPVITEANKINVFAEEGYSQLLTPGGVARMLWRMLRHKYPDITLQTCSGWLNDRERMLDLLPKIRLFSSSRSPDNTNGNGSPNKKRPTRPTTGRRSSAR